MRIGIDPKVDIVFHQLFATEENKNLLLNFINAVLHEANEKSVVELQLLPPSNFQASLQDKLSIVDVKARDESGKWFIIEMQIAMTQSYPKRMLYYWAKGYANQLKKRERYHLLKKVTLISISKEALPISSKNYYNHFKLISEQNKKSVVKI